MKDKGSCKKPQKQSKSINHIGLIGNITELVGIESLQQMKNETNHNRKHNPIIKYA
jgi:hypothetical protein